MVHDQCLFLRSGSEVVEDEHDPRKEIHYLTWKCIVIEGDMDTCPFPNRHCEYKEENEDPTVVPDIRGMEFKDGSILRDAVKELNGLFED